MRSGALTITRFAIIAALALGAEAAVAQVRPAIQGGPHFVGSPITIQLTAEGFDESSQPTVEVEPAAKGLNLSLVAVSPNVNSMVEIVNGRVTKSRTVRWVFTFRAVVERAGRFRVGPFTLKQGSKTLRQAAMALNVENTPTAEGHRAVLLLPEEPVYIGQRIPISFEWWIENSRANKIVSHLIRVPLLKQLQDFRTELIEGKSQQVLILDGPGGPNEVRANVSRRNHERQVWHVNKIDWQLTPLKAGTFDLPPASITLEEAVRFQRGLFGSKVPSHSMKLVANDEPRQIVVKPLPTEGRPPSFAGAVGKGYSLEAVANPTVVGKGEPIRLTLTLRGDGPLDLASLPPLRKSLPPELFSVPTGKRAGKFENGTKTFEVTVRILDESVREIPPIAYSWFNPELGTYETATSRPVAVSVESSQVVSATDVVRAEPQADEAEEDTADLTDGNGASDADQIRRAKKFTLTGADLSIETDPAVLARSANSPLASTTMQVLGYALGLLGLGLGIAARRRANLDPVAQALAENLAAQRLAIANASTVGQATDALRRIRAARPQGERPELDRLLAECDALVYAPGGQTARIDEALRARATNEADSMIKEVGQ